MLPCAAPSSEARRRNDSTLIDKRHRLNINQTGASQSSTKTGFPKPERSLRTSARMTRDQADSINFSLTSSWTKAPTSAAHRSRSTS